jgi:hypothetical protein
MSINIKTTLLNKKIKVLDIVIKYGDMDDYDFEIIGENKDEKDIIIKTLKTIFMTADRKYKVIYNDITYIPKNYSGIINMKINKIEKYCEYNEKNIGFCLYGKTRLYLEGALINEQQYKDYNCIFYTRDDIDIKVKNKLKNVIECCYMPGWFMMFTRFYPVENPNNKIYMSRDTDCRLNEREKSCINDWLKSDKNLHIIRDHPYHTTEILGGLWGFKDNNIGDIRIMIAEWCIEFVRNNKLYNKGPDQFFLKNIYKQYIYKAYINDEILNYENDNLKNPIKIKRKNKEYIGEAYDENNNILHSYLRNVIK